MTIGTAACLLLFLLLTSPSLQKDATISPWIPAKDVLLTFPATEAVPTSTYVHFLPHEDASGRRIPAAFIVKTPGDDGAVAYLTGAGGDLGEDLLAKVNEGDKVLLDFATYTQNYDLSWLVSCYQRPFELPGPFHGVRLTGVHLPKPFLSLTEFARYPAFGFPTGKITLVFVADRSEVFPDQEKKEVTKVTPTSDESEENDSGVDSD